MAILEVFGNFLKKFLRDPETFNTGTLIFSAPNFDYFFKQFGFTWNLIFNLVAAFGVV